MKSGFSLVRSKASLAALVLIFFFIIFPGSSPASDGPGTGPGAGKNELSLSAAYRTDRFDWNIGGYSSRTSSFVNVLSELKWTDLRIFQLKGEARTIMSRDFYLEGSFSYGWILDGKNQDSDYDGDNRTLEYSRSNNAADAGDVWDISASVGYVFWRRGVEVASLLGYSYNMQNLKITDGVQTIPATGPFNNLDSCYDALWYGPWVGLDLRYTTPGQRIRLLGTFEYHFVHYIAQANWNLISGFQHPVSFEHRADGVGFVYAGGLDYALTDALALNWTVNFQKWKAKDGVDETFGSTGSVGVAQLNEVNWESASSMFAVKYLY